MRSVGCRDDELTRSHAASIADRVYIYRPDTVGISAWDLERHPELKEYPVMELAPDKTAAKGVRYAPLYQIAGGCLGFGETHVKTATLDRSIPNLTILRCPTPPARGQYVLCCGAEAYEVRFE